MTAIARKQLKLHSIAIFRSLLTDPVISRLSKLMGSKGAVKERVDAYCDFASALLQNGDSLTEYILKCVLADENVYIVRKAQNQTIDPALEACVKAELMILNDIACLAPGDFLSHIKYDGHLPKWNVQQVDFVNAYNERIRNIHTEGYGIFSKYTKLRFRNGEIVPVLSTDPVRFADLKGYDKERGKVIDNTLALIGGKTAANILLYGDAGTGKSSTVKAIINEFQDKGLRLIEIGKKQVGDISVIIEKLKDNPLKFILFIDDLSFSQENDDLYELKAALEGSISTISKNVVIYATGNRRHLIKETFSDRQGDDVHRNETLQEQWSLSDRFGLSVGFMKPGKDLYLQIVHELADDYRLNIPRNELDILAERFALGGRSPRAARQLVEQLKCAQDGELTTSDNLT
jgi:predicted AAA+ superfamily ATPase